MFFISDNHTAEIGANPNTYFSVGIVESSLLHVSENMECLMLEEKVKSEEQNIELLLQFIPQKENMSPFKNYSQNLENLVKPVE